jgi:hypothetical protein
MSTWQDWVEYMSGFASNPERSWRGPIDWVALAISQIGGGKIEAASAILGLTPQTLYTWLEKGIGQARFDRIVLLSRKSGVSLEMLAKRLEPVPDAPDKEAHKAHLLPEEAKPKD